MKNYVQNGANLTITAGSAISSGDGVVVGQLTGVAVTDIANGAKGALACEGVFEFDIASGATLSVGDIGYLASATEIGDTNTDPAFGVVVAVAASKVEVKIYGRLLA